MVSSNRQQHHQLFKINKNNLAKQMPYLEPASKVTLKILPPSFRICKLSHLQDHSQQKRSVLGMTLNNI